MLKVKDDVDLSVLRDFGFITGREVNEEFDENNTFLVDDLSLDSWFKFFVMGMTMKVVLVILFKITMLQKLVSRYLQTAGGCG